MTVYRIIRWDGFEKRVRSLAPTIIFYQKDKHPLRKPPIGLRLIFYHQNDTYAFIDFADGSTLYKTGIPVHAAEVKNEGMIDDEEIKRFLTERFGNIAVRSMGTFSRG